MEIRILHTFTGRVPFDKNSPAFETGKNSAEIYLEMFPENPKSLNFRSAMKSIFRKSNGTEIPGKKVSKLRVRLPWLYSFSETVKNAVPFTTGNVRECRPDFCVLMESVH